MTHHAKGFLFLLKIITMELLTGLAILSLSLLAVKAIELCGTSASVYWIINCMSAGLRIWESVSSLTYTKNITFEYEEKEFPLEMFERSMMDTVRNDKNPLYGLHD